MHQKLRQFFDNFWFFGGSVIGMILTAGLLFVIFKPSAIMPAEGTITVSDVLANETMWALSQSFDHTEIIATSSPSQQATTPTPSLTPSPVLPQTFTPGPLLMTPFGSSDLTLMVYKVREGDSLGLIADLYNTTIDILQTVNSRESPALWIDDLIVVCVGCTTDPNLPPLQVLYLESGINLSELVQDYDCSVNDLRRWNGLGPSDWIIGHRYIILPIK